MAVRTICPCMAAPKQIKGGAVNDTGCLKKHCGMGAIPEHLHRAEDIMTRNMTSYTTCKVEICGI